MTVSKWEHEKTRIYSALERSGGRWDSPEFEKLMQRRLRAITKVEKAHNFAEALEDENLHDLARQVRNKETQLRMAGRTIIEEKIKVVESNDATPFSSYCEKCWVTYSKVATPADGRCKYCGGKILN